VCVRVTRFNEAWKMIEEEWGCGAREEGPHTSSTMMMTMMMWEGV